MATPSILASWAVLLLAVVVSPSCAFLVVQVAGSSSATWRSSNEVHHTLSASHSSIDEPIHPVQNEFSRPLNTDRILKTTAGKQRRSNRNYQISIEATGEECDALAKRFDLRGLASLQADLSLTPPPSAGANVGGLLTVQVEGSILAHLTQTCVRTNEDFEVDVDFPISCIVKPIAASNQLNLDDLFETDSGSAGDNDFQSQRSGGKKKKKSNSLRADRLNNLNDIMELQQMIDLQENDKDYSLDDMIEDESIYSLKTGNLDVGELVSQTFWLNLDPYPKKPGSGPMEFSISG